MRRSACCVRCDGRGDSKNGIDRGSGLGLLRRSLGFNVRHIEMQVIMFFFSLLCQAVWLCLCILLDTNHQFGKVLYVTVNVSCCTKNKQHTCAAVD